jgi:hypothetical protein
MAGLVVAGGRESLVDALVVLPGDPEAAVEAGMAGHVEQVVVQEPDGPVGHPVVVALVLARVEDEAAQAHRALGQLEGAQPP